MECNNQYVREWVAEVAQWLSPNSVKWVDGSEEEYRNICGQLEKDGVFTRLNADLYPNCFLSRSNPNDVARVEDRTFICSKSALDAGPLNNWVDPFEMKNTLHSLMSGCMQGRDMYVIPYLMGPDGSPFSKVGFELTDSLYVVANMHIMARTGNIALKNLSSSDQSFVRGVHSKGTLDVNNRYIVHFPETNEIISFNSDYGGNALQGKKCFALRIASVKAKKEGWLAEHMLILGITTPENKKYYICAAFPSACGKTNLSMLVPPQIYKEKGWKVETVGDDIAWLNFGADGKLYGINPESGFFGVAPGTSYKTNPNAMMTINKNTIFTNVALNLKDNTPWWEGMGDPPEEAIDWLGQPWSPAKGTKAAHPNSRFTAPAKQCPIISDKFDDPLGVPISAIIFGGRRASTEPLIYEAFDWEHGTFIGAILSSETTAAATGKVGQLRHDPMAMRPFIGYHVGDYLQHWLNIGKKEGAILPKIFHVNWFRKDSSGKYLWPGFGENIRVLEWIIRRCEGNGGAEETPLGYQPRSVDINLEGLDISKEDVKKLLSVDSQEWETDIASQKEFLNFIGEKLPSEIWQQHQRLKSRLGL